MSSSTFRARGEKLRWRMGSLMGGKVVLQGIGPDGRYNGVLRSVQPWWFEIWYVPTEEVPREVFLGISKTNASSRARVE